MLVPSILSTTEEDFKRKVETVNSSNDPNVEWVHIDVMDNKFVQNKSVDPDIIKKYPISKKIELHLMVEDPYFYISQFKEFPIDRFIIHSEVGKEKIDEASSFIRAFTDAALGIAFNPETSINKLTEYDYYDVDLVLLMSVHPGFSGQQFIPETLDKIKECVSLREKYNQDFLIEVDGGINRDNIKDVLSTGADKVVIGASLFEGDFYENIKKLTQ